MNRRESNARPPIGLAAAAFGCFAMLHAVKLVAGPATYGLRQAFDDAAEIVVGTVTGVRPAVDRTGALPRGLLSDTLRYACWLDLAVVDTLKGTASTKAASLHVLVFAAAPDCSGPPGTLDARSLGTAIWFLRNERGIRRTVVDNASATWPLYSVAESLVEATNGLASPGAKLAFVLLSPEGVQTKADYQKYVVRSAREVVSLGRWEDLLSASKRLFERKDFRFGSELCLALSIYRVCLECALPQGTRSVGEVLGPPPNDLKWFEETEVRKLSVQSLPELRRNFGYQNQDTVKQSLILDACTSLPRVRMRARQLLLDFFGVLDKQLPCPRCPAISTEARKSHVTAR